MLISKRLIDGKTYQHHSPGHHKSQIKLNVDTALFLHQVMGVDCVLSRGNDEFIAACE